MPEPYILEVADSVSTWTISTPTGKRRFVPGVYTLTDSFIRDSGLRPGVSIYEMPDSGGPPEPVEQTEPETPEPEKPFVADVEPVVPEPDVNTSVSSDAEAIERSGVVAEDASPTGESSGDEAPSVSEDDADVVADAVASALGEDDGAAAPDNSALTKDDVDNPVTAKVKCPHCPREFGTARGVKSHSTMVHGLVS